MAHRQLRDAVEHNKERRIEAERLIARLDDPTLAMIEAGYDATRHEDGTPQFFDAGFTLAHVGVIFRAVARNALDSARRL